MSELVGSTPRASTFPGTFQHVPAKSVRTVPVSNNTYGHASLSMQLHVLTRALWGKKKEKKTKSLADLMLLYTFACKMIKDQLHVPMRSLWGKKKQKRNTKPSRSHAIICFCMQNNQRPTPRSNTFPMGERKKKQKT